MPSTAYRDIVQRLDTLDSQESLELIAEIRKRMSPRRPSLAEFLDSRKAIPSSNEDWSSEMRDEWRRDF